MLDKIRIRKNLSSPRFQTKDLVRLLRLCFVIETLIRAELK